VTDIRSADMHLAGRDVAGTVQHCDLVRRDDGKAWGVTLAAAATDSAVSSQAVVAVQYAVPRPASESG